MNFTKYISGIVVATFATSPIQGSYSKLSDIEERNSFSTTRSNSEVIASFFRNTLAYGEAPKTKTLGNIVIAKTGITIAEPQPKTTPLRSTPFVYKGPLETARVPDALVAFLHEEENPHTVLISKEIDMKFDKYKGVQKKLSDAEKKADLILGVEDKWHELRQRAHLQKNEKFRPKGPMLTDAFYDEPKPYDICNVVYERRVLNRSQVRPSFYNEPIKEVRGWAARRQVWNSLKRPVPQD